MPLTGKYLKYSPEITLETFTLVWNKLIDSGINAQQGNDSVKSEYAHFSDKFSVLRLDHAGLFGAYTRTHDCKETTVQEILGYDPFVRNDFVLPEKWFIRCTNESKRLLDKWTGFTFKYINIYYDDEDGKTHSDNIIPDYTEITFEQFQKYVLNTEQPKVMEKDWGKATEEELLAEAKRRYPVGCTIKSAYDTSFNKTIDSDVFMIGFTEDVCYGDISGVSVYSKEYNRWAEIISLPETKVESKSIEKWSVGSYVVFCKDVNNIKKGYVDVIQIGLGYDNCIYLEKYLTMDTSREKSNEIKWFATLQEAEEFAKTLVKPVKEVKQSLKQAVHCKTQEEWDFVTEKLSYKWDRFTDWNIQKEKTFISLYSTEIGHIDVNSHNNQILSFQEWCDLNGYKMEKEVKFEVGQLVWISSKPMTGNGMNLGGRDDGVYKLMDLDSPEFATGHLNENSHFKFKCGKFYYKTNIKNIRHATPEEINNYLISIGQITRGEPLNNGIEPNKDGMFKYTTYAGTTHVGKTSTISGPLKMTLSIDDEELPMISIIKTNTIKQLLNIE